MRLALAADAASAYVDLRWAQQGEDPADNAKIRQHALELTRKRRRSGCRPSLTSRVRKTSSMHSKRGFRRRRRRLRISSI